MFVLGRPIDLPGLELLVGNELIAHLEDGHVAPVGHAQGDLRPHPDRFGLRLGNGNRDGHRPHQAVLEPHLAHDAQVVLRRHEALERRERADGDVFDIRGSALIECDATERLRFLGEALFLRPVHPAVDELAAVGKDELLGSPGSPTRHAHCAVDESELLELGENLGETLVFGFLIGLDDHVGLRGRLVGIVDTGEVLDLASKRLLIEALGVARGERIDGT